MSKTQRTLLKGARDIIAEQVSEDERARNAVRNLFARQAVISAKVVKGKDEEAAKYRDYFDFSSPLETLHLPSPAGHPPCRGRRFC